MDIFGSFSNIHSWLGLMTPYRAFERSNSLPIGDLRALRGAALFGERF
jgi:hypothetical protein